MEIKNLALAAGLLATAVGCGANVTTRTQVRLYDGVAHRGAVAVQVVCTDLRYDELARSLEGRLVDRLREQQVDAAPAPARGAAAVRVDVRLEILRHVSGPARFLLAMWAGKAYSRATVTVSEPHTGTLLGRARFNSISPPVHIYGSTTSTTVDEMVGPIVRFLEGVPGPRGTPLRAARTAHREHADANNP